MSTSPLTALAAAQQSTSKNTANTKRTHNGSNKLSKKPVEHAQSAIINNNISSTNLDISKEDLLEILNSSTSDKFLIQWSNNYAEQAAANQLIKVKPILHTKIVDYFATVS